MTKAKAVQAAQTALAAFKSQAAKVHQEREDTATEIAKLKAEIGRLENLPVSKKDFGLLLKEHIAAQAEDAEKRLIDTLTSVKRGFGQDAPIEKQSFDKMGLKALEVSTIGKAEYGTLRHNWIFSDWRAAHGSFLSGNFFDKEDRILSVLCYLFPDAVHDRIMQTVNSHYGDKWGNEELPSVSERRETITNLQTEIQGLESRLVELDAAIAEFNSLTAPAQNAALSDSERAILAMYS